MKSKMLRQVSDALMFLAASAALFYIITYIVIVILRAQYPFELEWMEGGSVDQVRRILAGHKLYVQPSLEFAPFIYTPLYFYVSALAAKIFGVGFESLRLVSILSSLGAFLTIYLIIKRETSSKFPAILGAGLFAATFEIGGSWFDIARVDSLSLVLLLGGVYTIRFYRSTPSLVIAGLLLSLAYFTKQTTLFAIVPLGLYSLLIGWPRAIFLIVTLLTVIVGVTFLLEYTHDGWYSYYVLNLPRQHPIVSELYLGYWADDLLAPLPIAIMLALFFLLAGIFLPSKNSPLFYLLLTSGLVLGSWVSRLHAGGYSNVLIPAYAVISILFGLGLHTSLRVFRSDLPEWKMLLKTFVSLAALIQLAALFYNPLSQVPTQADREAGEAFIEMLSQIDGEIYAPGVGFLPSRAGKGSYAHQAAIWDIMRGHPGPVRDQLDQEIREAIQERRFDAIIVNTHGFRFEHEIRKSYTKDQAIFSDAQVFWPATGLRTRPETVYLALPEARLPATLGFPPAINTECPLLLPRICLSPAR